MVEKLPKEELKVPDKSRFVSISDIQSALNILKEPATAAKISTILKQNGVSGGAPTLRLDIESASDKLQLELDPRDIEKLFARFGAIESVTVSPLQKSTAIVVFNDTIAAYLAQQTLHLHYVPAYQARIFVKWNSDDSAPTSTLGDLPPIQRTS